MTSSKRELFEAFCKVMDGFEEDYGYRMPHTIKLIEDGVGSLLYMLVKTSGVKLENVLAKMQEEAAMVEAVVSDALLIEVARKDQN